MQGAREGTTRAPARPIHTARRLRRALTLPEVVLWTRLRRGGLNGAGFCRQHPTGPYVLDVYCADARLAVEVDGAAHDAQDQVAHDARRTAWLAKRDIRVLRLPAADVLRGEEAGHVLPTISAALRERERRAGVGRPLHRLRRSPFPLRG